MTGDDRSPVGSPVGSPDSSLTSWETVLRARLHDLADQIDGDDVATGPVVRAATAADPAPVVAIGPRRRRTGPVLAAAAVVVGVLAAGGIGFAVFRGGDDGVPTAASEVASQSATIAGNTGAEVADSAAVADGGPGGCDDLGVARSEGPLARLASIRPAGITGSATGPGGSAAVPYVLSFAGDGGTVSISGATVARVRDGRLLGAADVATPDHAREVDATAGTVSNGTVQFSATGCDGAPLPAGEYEVAVSIRYRSGDIQGVLVSPPVAVRVS